MLVPYPKSAPLADAVWIDLVDPSEAERVMVEEAVQVRLPTREALDEIEYSSRAYLDNGTAYFSTPVPRSKDCLNSAVTPLGFVLTADRLITLRFASVAALDEAENVPQGATAREMFLRTLEVIVDEAADVLENASAQLDRTSQAAFRTDRPRGIEAANASAALHGALSRLGRVGEGISHVRDTLLGVGRIATFPLDETKHGPVSPTRLRALRHDIESLNDYQQHLFTKVQFLLDATLGFINIQQNDIVKALTVVSVVGVPPVLVVGVYGMNFQYMPELHWPLGYPFVLALLVVTTLAPLWWFKRRGWI